MLSHYTKPAPLRKARVIEQMRNHISTQMIAVRKASGIVQMPNHISTQTIAVRKVIGIARFLKCVVWGEG